MSPDARVRSLERDALANGDPEAFKQAALARCRAGDHYQCSMFVGKVLDNGKLAYFCRFGRYGCPVCMICNQIACDHAHLFDPRKQTFNRYWAEARLEGE